MPHWSFPNDGSLFAAYYGSDGRHYRLSVEPMPDGDSRWEWRAGDSRNPQHCRHGYAPRLQAACRLAECAAAELDGASSVTLALMGLPALTVMGGGARPAAAAA